MEHLSRIFPVFDFGTTWRSMVICQQNDVGGLHIGIGLPPFTPGSELIMVVPETIKAREWCHLALVSGPKGLNCYFNGVLVASDSYPGSFAAIGNGDHNYLGHSNWAAAPFKDKDLDGQMDDVRVWRTQRSEAQIRDNMGKQLTGREDGLVSLWSFEDSNKGVVSDSGPGRHHGKLVGRARTAVGSQPTLVGSSVTPPTQVVEAGSEPILLLPDGGSSLKLPAGILNGLRELTIEGWVRWDNGRAWTSAIYFGHPGRNHKLDLNQTDASGTLRFNLDDSKNGKLKGAGIEVPDAIALGRWLHFAAVVTPKGALL